MRCCVPGCKNDSRRISKSQGITFHTFPTEQTLRSSWLRALGRDHWQPKERSAICSVHFINKDLYETRNGLRKVKAGAVPVLTLDFPVSSDFGEPASLKVCRMCLKITEKLYSITSYNLEKAFEDLTSLNYNEDDRMPQMLCSICTIRLQNYKVFRENSIRANNLMMDILNKQDCLTLDSIQNIDLTIENIQIKLTKTTTVDNYNLTIEHNETNDNLDKLETKSETDFDYEEDIFDIKQDLKYDNDLEITEKVFSNEEEKLNQNEQEISENTNQNVEDTIECIEFDSEDSIPLEETRKRKKKRKVEKINKIKKVKKKKDIEPKIDRRRKPFLNSDLNETLFTITDLSYDEQIAEIEKRRETDNYKHAVFKCMECYKGFLDQDAYNGHMLRHTSKCGEHQCDICKTYFKHSHALRKHITAHHTQRFSCNQCTYVTTHRQTARLHEKWHKGTKYVCPHCKEIFVKFTTYMGHIRIKHPSDFVCQLCGYSFVSAKGIELHKKLKHRNDDLNIPDDGPFCESCNVRFATVEAYRKHVSISSRHSSNNEQGNKKPKKERKTRDLKDRSKLNMDLEDDYIEKRRHPSQWRKAEGPIPCEQCGLQLEDSRAYHGHFRRMHPDKNRTKYPSMKSPCMCELCGRIFQSHALLKDHTWTHTGERPFKCEQCGKCFRMKQRLVAHRRVHSDVKASYVCSVCGKHFTTHSNRQRHMFIHTGLKPFKCEMCGKGFKHASEKRAHITYVHLKKPWPKRPRGKKAGRQTPPPGHNENQELCDADNMAPVWQSCDPKLTDLNIINDKPIYYNIKI